MCKSSSDDDIQLETESRAFWDAHLPIINSVSPCYSYPAIRLWKEGCGEIVVGYEPEFEEAGSVADSFEGLLQLIAGIPDAMQTARGLEILL